MSLEPGEPNDCYDGNSDSSDDGKEKTWLKSSHIQRFMEHERRRTISENSDKQNLRNDVHIRRRVKSGDDGRRDRHNHNEHVKQRSKSGHLFSHHLHEQSEDRKPLLKPKDDLKVCIDMVSRVVKCTLCNCAHSDDSSCDTSCSSHCHSHEKILPGNSTVTKPCHDGDHPDFNDPSSQYDAVNELHVCNNRLEKYGEIPHRHHKSVLYMNGQVPKEDAAHMLLEDDPSKAAQVHVHKPPRAWRAAFGLIILLLANTLNYMDRYTIAGVLLDVKSFYGIQNNELGLLQTSFIISYMVFSPLFGYMGDRYSRKLIMAVGIFFWSVITLGSSFIDGQYFYLFLLMRALVGIGEASYSTIAPTIIADLYVGTRRTKALAVFYFAIPVGSGLGYIAGSKFAAAMGNWQWALRITPALGLICVAMILIVVKEPQRGAAEGSIHLSHSTWCQDLAYLFRHKSFMLSSAGFTCVAFIAGALALWIPTYMYHSIRLTSDANESTVSMIFGLVTCFSGFVGVALGSWVASHLRIKMGSRADPLVCAFGLITCAPFLYLALYLSKPYPNITWALIFFGETLLALNWALVTDILLYIVVPNRRATAEAVQILMSHLFGDAGSPYLVGQMADVITGDESFPPMRAGQYLSLQYSMYMCCFVAVIGGGFFLLTSLYIQKDKNAAHSTVNILNGSNVTETSTVPTSLNTVPT